MGWHGGKVGGRGAEWGGEGVATAARASGAGQTSRPLAPIRPSRTFPCSVSPSPTIPLPPPPSPPPPPTPSPTQHPLFLPLSPHSLPLPPSLLQLFSSGSAAQCNAILIACLGRTSSFGPSPLSFASRPRSSCVLLCLRASFPPPAVCASCMFGRALSALRSRH